VREREQQLNLNEKSIRPSFCVLPLMVPPSTIVLHRER
jgi:hypothetical protein